MKYNLCLIKKGKRTLHSAIFIIISVMSLAGYVWTITPAEAGGQSVDAEMQRFQGAWALIAAEKDGKKVDDADLQKSRMTVVGNKLELTTPHQSKDMIIASLTKLDLAKNPKEIHWVRTTGPNAGTTLKAIYEFAGPDQFQICFDPAGLTVPQKFATTAGSGYILHTWKRVKQ